MPNVKASISSSLRSLKPKSRRNTVSSEDETNSAASGGESAALWTDAVPEDPMADLKAELKALHQDGGADTEAQGSDEGKTTSSKVEQTAMTSTSPTSPSLFKSFTNASTASKDGDTAGGEGAQLTAKIPLQKALEEKPGWEDEGPTF